ncbi:hypothetical protein E0H80_00090 [Acinetobacter sp. ANC 4779]|uniref:hypothetical protein n=1 Tax=Acinetobacter sp. ANC 4779 TaxID=2529848 RepID=UPI00103B3842|nr:hypothetical protein [Acinetobacter sp. ANC 4779]TCB52320.1 hypothetical protein E0H80_00090 [Acinetobacter sp. ANC 4779]
MKKTISALLVGLVAASFTMTTMAAPTNGHKAPVKHYVSHGHKAPVKHHVSHGHKAPVKHYVSHGHKAPVKHHAR